jgi:hypothetical protein
VVKYSDIADMPGQLQKNIDPEVIRQVEARLPKPANAGGNYRYYNPLRCPYCGSPYIDFEKFREMRPDEYYGCYFPDKDIQTL